MRQCGGKRACRWQLKQHAWPGPHASIVSTDLLSARSALSLHSFPHFTHFLFVCFCVLDLKPLSVSALIQLALESFLAKNTPLGFHPGSALELARCRLQSCPALELSIPAVCQLHLYLASQQLHPFPRSAVIVTAILVNSHIYFSCFQTRLAHL